MTSGTLRTATVVHLAVLVALLGGLASSGNAPWTSGASWWSAFIVVNLGVFTGNLAMTFLQRSASESRLLAVEGRRQDLEDNRRIAIQQLRQLEAERGKVSAEDYARERAELLAIGAAAMRELEEGAWLTSGDPASGAAPTVVGHATSPGTNPHLDPLQAMMVRLRLERESNPQLFDEALATLGLGGERPGGVWRGALYTMLTVGLVALMGWLASDGAKPRAEGMSMTGGESLEGPGAAAPMQPRAPAAGPPPATPREVALQAKITDGTADLATYNELTELALMREDQLAAMNANDKARSLDPKDPDARVFRGVLLAFIDQVPKAWQEIDAVIAERPDHVRALVYRGLLSLKQDPKKAVEVLEKANALEPSPQIQAILAEARNQLGGAPATPSAGTPEVLVSGTIEAPAGTTGGMKLFVSVRDPAGGPPVAAVTLPPGPFPMTFEVTSANRISMGGNRPLPAQLALTVRLDSDGDPLTRPPTDPAATLPAVTPGTTGIALTLGPVAP